MQGILRSLVFLSVASYVMLPTAASANEVASFPINNHVSDVWIGNVEIEQGIINGFTPNVCPSEGACLAVTGSSWTSEGAKIVMPYGIPTCGNQYHTEGYIELTYTNGDAYITRTLNVGAPDEGYSGNMTWTVQGYYGNPFDGHVNVVANVSCVFHGNLNGAAPGGLQTDTGTILDDINPFNW